MAPLFIEVFVLVKELVKELRGQIASKLFSRYPIGISLRGSEQMTKTSIFSFFLLGATTASADVIDLVTQSGKWGTTCPPIVCSQPGDSWSYSFLTDSHLTPVAGDLETTITGFEFSLNGAPVIALTGKFDKAHWFAVSNDGGFTLLDSSQPLAPQPIVFGFWVQLFALPSLTLNPGVYPVPQSPPPGTFEELFGDRNIIPGPVVITATPEPSSIVLISTMLLVGSMIRRRIARRRIMAGPARQ
jgi:hypothetical protein